MIKQIQLRGISRTPSDRMTADGGCAESLNVHLDDQELAPTLEPKDITSQLGFWDDPEAKAIFIHKTSRAEHLILLKGDSVGYAKNGSFAQLFTFDNETLVDVASIGNTLIVSTSKHSHYVKWKQDELEYVYLRPRIPEPVIEFIDVCGESEDIVTARTAYSKEDWDKVHVFDEGVWNGILKGTYDAEEEDYTKFKGEIDEIINSIWSSFQIMFASNRSAGYFSAPLLARYALKLYDGNYIYQSAPVLLGGAGGSHMVNRDITMVTYRPEVHVYGKTGCVVTTNLNNFGIHKVTAKFAETFDLGDWKELVQSVDIFLSPEIYSPALYLKFESMEQTNIPSDPPGILGVQGTLSLGKVLDTEDEDNIIKNANFYKVASFPVDDLAKLVDGYDIKPVSQDMLLVQQTLPDDQFSHHEVTAAKESMTYNNRFLLGGTRTKLYTGYPLFGSTMLYNFINPEMRPSWVEDNGISGTTDYYFIFYVKDKDGSSYKVKQKLITPTHIEGNYPEAYGWIAYPDTKCYRAQLVYLADGAYRVHTFTMKEHPRLNCAYCFLGFRESLFDTAYEVEASNPLDRIDNEDAWYYNKKQLILSDVDNPFVFPIANRMSMSGDIIEVATTTKALSAGQFGEFPLYAFTADGIWALPISATGVFAGSRPLARDVAIEGTISPIDQAIVFVTERGVMLLQGSDIRNLSPNMNGTHYRLEEDASRLLERDENWRPFIGIVRDGTPFMSFMKKAIIASDYAGNRLICFNKELPTYQYVFMLDTNTWHKIASPEGLKVERVLNSYPDTYVACRMADASQGEVSKILNYSTFLDVSHASQENIKGMIVTRPFDLEAPDLRKSLNDIRIRGQFNRTDVKYILLGSMDGINWGLLPSLRGGSYKLFRLVILANLSPNERISWVDIDFDIRFTNRLR